MDLIDPAEVSTREHPGPFDAFETAKPGEPIFTLQGGDPLSPPTILHWAGLARTAAVAEPDPEKARKLLVKATNAEVVAWTMRAYQRGEVELSGQDHRATYLDKSPDSVEGIEAAKRHGILVGAARRLDNAVAECLAAAEEIEGLGLTDDATALRATAYDILKPIAANIEPRRDMWQLAGSRCCDRGYPPRHPRREAVALHDGGSRAGGKLARVAHRDDESVQARPARGHASRRDREGSGVRDLARTRRLRPRNLSLDAQRGRTGGAVDD